MDRTRSSSEGVEDIIKRKNRQLWDMFDEKESLRMELEAVRAKDNGVTTKELESTNEDLTREHKKLIESKAALDEDLRKTRIEANAWKSLAENVQEMQEMAISAFERCNALERENIDLKEAMDAFAEGSASFTIQQLQKIITGLTEEVARNHSIIKAMRKQTIELKRRSTQSKNTENTALATIDLGTNRPDTGHNAVLAPIPSFTEFFLI
ncbi:hypothetical protein BC629DRAFT_1730558 [Irpex lacteus]|nr:hypothetical protein BC629DRAFT_1730558 [Irpex lacteus]